MTQFLFSRCDISRGRGRARASIAVESILILEQFSSIPPHISTCMSCLHLLSAEPVPTSFGSILPPLGAAETSPQKEPQLNLKSTTHNHKTTTNSGQSTLTSGQEARGFSGSPSAPLQMPILYEKRGEAIAKKTPLRKPLPTCLDMPDL